MRIRLPRRLQAVPDLGPYEINVGALTQHHVGLIVIIVRRHSTLCGQLVGVPMESLTKPLLIVELSDFVRVPLHPAFAVHVVPKGYKASISIDPVREAVDA